jgi:hypothetical protein
MKTRNSLITLGAVTVAAITLNFTASAALLSPRATGNQNVHTTGKGSDVNLVALGLTPTAYAAPRLAGNKALAAVGANTEVNPATLCAGRMTALPKAIQACAANASMPMSCCAVAEK